MLGEETANSCNFFKVSINPSLRFFFGLLVFLTVQTSFFFSIRC